jgi:uncharacterized membrane protein
MPPQAPAPVPARRHTGGAALGGYALLSHLLMVQAPDRAWTVAALFGPLWAAVAIAGWLRRHWPTLAACAAVFVLITLVVARGGVDDIHLMYVLQHAGVHAALAWAFFLTLRPGQVPLITGMAERVHRTVTPAMRQYTHGLTKAWVVYFVAMIAISFVLYALAPWPWWSLFCNVLTPLAVLAFFVVELGWRRLRHPEFERVSPMHVWQAWRQRQAGGVPR